MELNSAEDWLQSQIHPTSRRHVPCRGEWSFIYLRGNLQTSEQGCIGIYVRQDEPELIHHWQLWPVPALADNYNSDTLASWARAMASAESALHEFRSTGALPSVIRFDPLTPWRDVDLLTFVERITSNTAGFHHQLAKQQRHGGEEPNPQPAINPILRRIAAHRLAEMLLLENTDQHQIARFDHTLVGVVSPGCSEEAMLACGVKLATLRNDNDSCSLCIECPSPARQFIDKLLLNMEKLGVGCAIGDSADAVIDKFEQLQRHL